ncbi:hypothetical protein [Nonomuraea sp. WAC 01424]|uniref:hypothetical protein n=1 Tax=Nonomuraea sp. WAC 01424 TaxID=2203200 RepID=UPI000F76B762|nr:hypothetical protein [Nonomuraea sp. WAC 01424]
MAGQRPARRPPGGGVVEFSTMWVPPPGEDRHYCVVVRLRLYQDPVLPSIVETDIFNNEARSNYTRFVSATSSPSSRVGTRVRLANPFDAATLVHAVVRQRHPYHRVFLEHQWLRVEAGSSRAVEVHDEALAGFPELAVVGGQEALEELWRVPNLVSVAGWAARPFPADCGARTLTGGVTLRVDAGRATAVVVEHAGRTAVAGDVRLIPHGDPVPEGIVLVVVRGRDPGQFCTTTMEVRPDGTFGGDLRNPLGRDADTVEAHYLGAVSYAPSESRPQPLTD